MQTKLKYVVKDTDRHGNTRIYFRKAGKKVRLRGPLNSPDFLEDYRAVLLGFLVSKPNKDERPLIKSESIRELCIGYFQSSTYKKLAPRGQKVRRGILERFCQNKHDGEKPYKLLEPSHLRKRHDAMMDRPEAANSMIKAVRQLYKYAIEYEDFDRNPAAAVKYFPGNPDGYHAWSLDEIAQFEEQHPIGTTARLAMALALYTGQRRSDLVDLGRQNIVMYNGVEWLKFTQHKNRNKAPVHLEIPIVPELRSIIDTTPTGDLVFLHNGYNKPFTSNGFGNKFRDWCDEANLPQCAVHGLRKAAAARLAEEGCSEQEIMAITGHKTSKEIIR